MKTLIRQLSLEAIENCITCLNYCFDSVVFVGDRNIIEEERKNISSFLKKYCDVVKVEFKTIDECATLKNIVDTIEQSIGIDKCYIDLTGGEGLCEAALVRVSYKHNIPMHLYDVRRDICVNVDDDVSGTIFDVERRKINLTIDKYIEMVGGVINKNMQKLNKKELKPELFELKNKYSKDWNAFCGAVQRTSGTNLKVSCNDATEVCMDISLVRLYDIISDGVSLKLFKGFKKSGKSFCFSFMDDDIRHTVCETGSLFEQLVYNKEKGRGGECAIGVHLDWDGIISGENSDVLNEVDVLKLEGNILTFISCKDTKKLNNTALYELESVARRFGGNYAKMKIATRAQVLEVTRSRAKEMGIEIEEY